MRLHVQGWHQPRVQWGGNLGWGSKEPAHTSEVRRRKKCRTVFTVELYTVCRTEKRTRFFMPSRHSPPRAHRQKKHSARLIVYALALLELLWRCCRRAQSSGNDSRLCVSVKRTSRSTSTAFFFKFYRYWLYAGKVL